MKRSNISKVDNSPIINKVKWKTGEIAHRKLASHATLAFFNFTFSLLHTYAGALLHKSVGRCYTGHPRKCLLALLIPSLFPFQPTSHLLYQFYFPFNFLPFSRSSPLPICCPNLIPNMPLASLPLLPTSIRCSNLFPFLHSY